MNIPLKLKILETGRPQIVIARDSGISEAQLSRIVKGWAVPGEEVKNKLAKILKCPVEEIFPKRITNEQS